MGGIYSTGNFTASTGGNMHSSVAPSSSMDIYIPNMKILTYFMRMLVYPYLKWSDSWERRIKGDNREMIVGTEYVVTIIPGDEYPVGILYTCTRSPRVYWIHKNLIVNPLNLKLRSYLAAAMILRDAMKRIHDV